MIRIARFFSSRPTNCKYSRGGNDPSALTLGNSYLIFPPWCNNHEQFFLSMNNVIERIERLSSKITGLSCGCRIRRQILYNQLLNLLLWAPWTSICSIPAITNSLKSLQPADIAYKCFISELANVGDPLLSGADCYQTDYLCCMSKYSDDKGDNDVKEKSRSPLAYKYKDKGGEFRNKLESIRYEEFEASSENCKRRTQDSSRKCKEKLIKVMSYNVLSQTLLEMHGYLYRNHSRTALEWSTRKKLLLEEIKRENPDILCIQELEESHLASFFHRLEKLGYNSKYKQRTGGKVDGVAIYYRSSMFTAVEVVDVEFHQPDVRILNRDNVGLILRLQLIPSSSGRKPKVSPSIVVATTHLLYNPRRADVRLAQIQLLLAEIDRVADNRSSPSGYLPVILTGDLNAHLGSNVHNLLEKGCVPLDCPQHLPPHLGVQDNCQHVDKTNIKLYNSARPTQPPSLEADDSVECQLIEEGDCSREARLCHSLALRSVYNCDDGCRQEATTHQDRWVTVDYIFYNTNSGLELISKLRLPSPEECATVLEQIPNVYCPSDHLPLQATFLLRSWT